jgi:hypothetical protein
VSFQATGSDGVEVTVPGAVLPADGALRLTVDIGRLEAPATLWFVTSGSAIALAQCEAGAARAVQGRELTVNRWWRLELRAGSAANGDVLALTNPVYVAAG